MVLNAFRCKATKNFTRIYSGFQQSLPPYTFRWYAKQLKHIPQGNGGEACCHVTAVHRNRLLTYRFSCPGLLLNLNPRWWLDLLPFQNHINRVHEIFAGFKLCKFVVFPRCVKEGSPNFFSTGKNISVISKSKSVQPARFDMKSQV